MKRIMAVYGTRPEAIKMAPVVEALRESADFETLVTVTGQHRSILDQVNRLFGITPDHDLGILSAGQTLTDITNRTLHRLQPVLERERPDAVLVQGDTTTTLAGALAAFYQKIPVVHMEAGLRTQCRYSPYPEEMNRRLTTRLADLHLAPTTSARQNLLGEGVAEESVVVTGNTVIDALLRTLDRTAGQVSDPTVRLLDADPRRVVLVTAHRRESWGQGMESIGGALSSLASLHPDLLVVFPIHRNPAVRSAILPKIAGLENVKVVEPLDYEGFAHLMNRAHLILTDSGGIQEEGPSLGKPVLVMREATERPEGVAAGTVVLVGTDGARIVAEVTRLLRDPVAYARMAQAVNPYGDGFAAERTVQALGHWFGLCDAPADFTGAPDVPAATTAADDLPAQSRGLAPVTADSHAGGLHLSLSGGGGHR
ncbi:non-hydrolyzing UDP-N-acetylglucosamine 2-epimerase [Streptomyces sp. NPDC093984]|uniref:non-hydrolyzing UDP-N-acetylglucosamine 2-epimerase n=1 Tax=Streptomyces sp. NPDC093984 TaxID=3366052 RepID=UPI0038120F97